MSESANNGAAPGDHARRLWDLVADAIVAAHVRLASGSHAESIQFLYMFLDYLRLALPGPPHLLVARTADLREAKTAPALSTRTGGVMPVAGGDSAFEQCAFCDAVTLLLDFVDCEQPARGTFDELLTQLRQVASQRAPRIGQRLGQTLLDGLESVIEQTAGGGTGNPGACDTSAASIASAPDGVDAVVVAVHRHLAEALSGADMSYQLVLRNWRGSQPTYSVFGFREGDADRIEPDGPVASLRDDPDRREWRPAVEAALNAGFAQFGELPSRGEQLFVVPCHFGGVPWLAVCRPVQMIDHGDWWAYSTYRDLIPRLNDAVRMAGWSSLFEEMKRLFLEAVPSVAGDPRQLAQVVNTSWATLPRVFPVPPPCLQAVSDTGAAPDESLLTILGRHWRVSFAGGTNSYFPAALPAEVGTSGRWGRFSERELQRGFVVPVRAQLHMEQARVDTELAEAAYAIGHPLKHRLEPISGDLGTVENRIKQSDLNAALFELEKCKHRVDAAKRTSKCLDMMAELCRASGRAERMDEDKGFYAHEPYPLGRKIGPMTTAAAPHLSIDIQSRITQGAGMTVACTIPTRGRPSRLFDPFFDDLIFELALNASNRVPPGAAWLRITVAAIDHSGKAPQSALDFTNPARPVHNPESRLLFPADGAWHRWVTTSQSKKGPKGGLRFLATALRSSGTGDIYARLAPCGDHCVFGLRVLLPLRSV